MAFWHDESGRQTMVRNPRTTGTSDPVKGPEFSDDPLQAAYTIMIRAKAANDSAHARAANVQSAALKQNLPSPAQQDSTTAKYASLHRGLSIHAEIEAKNQRKIAAQQPVQPDQSAARKRNP